MAAILQQVADKADDLIGKKVLAAMLGAGGIGELTHDPLIAGICGAVVCVYLICQTIHDVANLRQQGELQHETLVRDGFAQSRAAREAGKTV